MRFIYFVPFMLLTSYANAAPEGYYEVASSEDGAKWFMHYNVSVRSIKENPKDLNVLADIWYEASSGQGFGYKQAFNCKEPGSAFNVIASSDGGLTRSNPTYYVKGTIGYGMWDVACNVAVDLLKKSRVPTRPPKTKTF